MQSKSPQFSATREGPRIQRALQRALQHLERRPTLTAIAAEAGLSRSRFEHLFKQEFGVAYRNYRREARVKIAKRILADPRVPIKEVSFNLGYVHPSSFTRDFKTHRGTTPSQYRRLSSGRAPDEQDESISNSSFR